MNLQRVRMSPGIMVDSTKNFAQIQSLRDHTESAHENLLHDCSHCEFKSRNKISLRRHVQTVHENKKWTKFCKPCGKEIGKSYFAQHVRSVHENYKIKCNHCEKEYKEKRDLRKHYRLKHPEKEELAASWHDELTQKML